MTTSTLSRRRRHLIIAAAVGAALPGSLLARECVGTPGVTAGRPTVTELTTETSGDKLIVTGRVFGGDCRPLPGALVELWNTETRVGVSAATGLDGRFTLRTAAAIRGPIHIRVTHNGKILVTRRQASRERAFS